MAKRKRKEPQHLRRLKAQTNAIHSMNKLLFACVGLGVGCVVFATYFPAKRHLVDLQRKREETLQQEQIVMREKEYRETELRALKSDPEFLELKAMDRLNLRHADEKIFRMKRNN